MGCKVELLAQRPASYSMQVGNAAQRYLSRNYKLSKKYLWTFPVNDHGDRDFREMGPLTGKVSGVMTNTLWSMIVTSSVHNWSLGSGLFTVLDQLSDATGNC